MLELVLDLSGRLLLDGIAIALLLAWPFSADAAIQFGGVIEPARFPYSRTGLVLSLAGFALAALLLAAG